MPGPEQTRGLDPHRAEISIDQLGTRLRELAEQYHNATDPSARNATIDTLINQLGSSSVIGQRLAAKALRQIGAPAADVLLRTISTSANERLISPAAKALGVLAQDHEGIQDRTLSVLVRLLSSFDEGVVRAGATGIRVLGGKQANATLVDTLKHCPVKSIAPILSELGLASELYQIPEVIVAATSRGLTITDFPALFGAALSPYLAAKMLPEGNAISQRYGWIDRALDERMHDPHVLEACRTLLRAGCVCTLELVERYLDTSETERGALVAEWIARRDSLSWVLLSDDVRGFRTAAPIRLGDDPGARIDQALLFSALRENDHANIQIKRERSPFDALALAPIPGRFFHITFAAFRELYLTSYQTEAYQILSSCEQAFRARNEAEVIMSLARADSETRRFEWNEARALLWAEWTGRSRSFHRPPTMVEMHPPTPLHDEEHGAVIQGNTATDDEQSSLLRPIPAECRWAVLDWERTDQVDSALRSVARTLPWVAALPSVRSLIKLRIYTDLSLNPNQILDELLRAELVHPLLPTIGTEVQSDTVPFALQYGWKGAFDYFGIPSRRRPEFEGVTEASIRPSRSSRTQAELLRAVRTLAFPHDRELAVHVSVGADLGAEAPFLGLPLLLLNRAPVERYSDSEQHRANLKNLMSKGLICRDSRCEPIHSRGVHSTLRTEIRIAPLGSDNSELEKFILEAIQFGAAAAASANEHPEQPESKPLIEAWNRYKAAVISLTDQSSLPLKPFLEQSWYQATGDCYDQELFDQLPIVDALTALHRASRQYPQSRLEVELRARSALDGLVEELRPFLMKA